MIDSKLIIVEGIPGAGKSSTAAFIRQNLADAGISTRLYLEGDLDHPADYESVACLSQDEFDALSSQFLDKIDWLVKGAWRQGEHIFLPYRKMGAGGCPESLCLALSCYDVYQAPLERYLTVARERWAAFTRQAQQEEELTIFECCFLQNPITTLLARHNRSEQEIQAFILSIGETIESLHPALIYLDTPDVRGNLAAVARNRPAEWLDFVIEYVTGQGLGREQGWSGFEGMVRFYTKLRIVSHKVFEALTWPKMMLDLGQGDWALRERLLHKFLEQLNN